MYIGIPRNSLTLRSRHILSEVRTPPSVATMLPRQLVVLEKAWQLHIL